MARTIDYYFSLSSPWAYIGHAPFTALVKAHGLTVNAKPVLLGRVFDQTGGLPLPKRHPARQHYRMLELQRWRDRRGLTFALKPEHWPLDATLADRFAIAAQMDGDPAPFLARAFPAVWEEERNLADPQVLVALAGEAGFDGARLLERAQSAATEAIYALNLENAVSDGVFGSPSYVLDGEVFWGQDRIELLDDMLKSGRAAYRGA